MTTITLVYCSRSLYNELSSPTFNSSISFSIIQTVFSSINRSIQSNQPSIQIFRSPTPQAKMQFTIISVLSLAVMALALPAEMEKRTDSQDAANKCSQTQTLKCCDSVNTGINLIPIGVNCVNINGMPSSHPASGQPHTIKVKFLTRSPLNSGCCPLRPMRRLPEACLLLQR